MKLTRTRGLQVILLLASVGLVAQAAASTSPSPTGAGAAPPSYSDVTDQTADAATSVVTTATGMAETPETY